MSPLGFFDLIQMQKLVENSNWRLFDRLTAVIQLKNDPLLGLHGRSAGGVP